MATIPMTSIAIMAIWFRISRSLAIVMSSVSTMAISSMATITVTSIAMMTIWFRISRSLAIVMSSVSTMAISSMAAVSMAAVSTVTPWFCNYQSSAECDCESKLHVDYVLALGC